MANPTSFEIGRQIGTNFAPSIERQTDISSIDDIFAQVSEQSQDGKPDFDGLMAQIMTRVSPQNQQAAMNMLQGKKKEAIEKSAQSEYIKIGDDIEKNFPDSAAHKSIASILRSNLPAAEKGKLVKDIGAIIPFKMSQQERLAKDSVLKRYGTLIKEKQKELETAKRADRERINQEIKDYQKRRNTLLDLFESEEGEEGEEMGKVKFDKTNQDHIKIYETLKEKLKGDKGQINEALSEVFTL